MNLEELIEEQWETISRKMAVIQEALTWSASGQAVIEQSAEFTASEPMQRIMELLSDPDAREVDRFTLSQYFAQSLEGEPVKNMKRFEGYLSQIAGNPQYGNQQQWYQDLTEAVAALRNSGDFEGYVGIYNNFQQDESKDASDARALIKRMNSDLKAIIDNLKSDMAV